MKTDFDIIIIGAGIAGCAAAFSIGNDGRNVLLIERDLSEPDRIVGELLQPGGVKALHELDTLDGIDGIWTNGYTVFKSSHENVVLPYPKGKFEKGIGFHHGKFIMSLRKKVAECPNVTILEGTAVELLKCSISEQYLGVKVKIKEQNNTYLKRFFADFTVVADGCFSGFRKEFIDSAIEVKSHFAGLVLKNCELPCPAHGHVILAKPCPILLYQIGTNDTRILVDIPSPLPKTSNGDMEKYMRNVIGPQLPISVQPSFYKGLDDQRVRSMPCSWLPPSQNSCYGVFVVGDAMNMRHPLTGGGMSVAFWDIIHLRNLLREIPNLNDGTGNLQKRLLQHHWERKSLSSVVNILANALYELFSANDGKNELKRSIFD